MGEVSFVKQFDVAIVDMCSIVVSVVWVFALLSTLGNEEECSALFIKSCFASLTFPWPVGDLLFQFTLYVVEVEVSPSIALGPDDKLTLIIDQ